MENLEGNFDEIQDFRQYSVIKWNQNMYKKPDVNPDLPVGLKILIKKNLPNQDFWEMFVLGNKKSRILGKISIG
jgi:hypothetical protein